MLTYMAGSLVGAVIHYYTKIGVAIIELSDSLALGDRISIEGATTDLKQTVDSMQIEHKNVEKAVKGDIIGLKVEGRCRVGDKVCKQFVKIRRVFRFTNP